MDPGQPITAEHAHDASIHRRRSILMLRFHTTLAIFLFIEDYFLNGSEALNQICEENHNIFILVLCLGIVQEYREQLRTYTSL